MSNTEKMCGISYKLDVPVKDRVDFLKKVYPDKVEEIDKCVEEWEGDWFNEFLSDIQNRGEINKWKLMTDYNNDLAWVFLTDSGESYGDINFVITFQKMSEYYWEIVSANLVGLEDGVETNKLKAFAFDWYNGSDCPLIF